MHNAYCMKSLRISIGVALEAPGVGKAVAELLSLGGPGPLFAKFAKSDDSNECSQTAMLCNSA